MNFNIPDYKRCKSKGTNYGLINATYGFGVPKTSYKFGLAVGAEEIMCGRNTQ